MGYLPINICFRYRGIINEADFRTGKGDVRRCAISLRTIRELSMLYKVPLILTAQPEGGFTVTSPIFPELVTEGDSIDEAMANVRDALAAVLEIYQDLGRSIPPVTQMDEVTGPVWLETLVSPP
jgi:antitoxin HicB